jgi:septal ring factor EnvC (AmiA/AmiB activator)
MADVQKAKQDEQWWEKELRDDKTKLEEVRRKVEERRREKEKVEQELKREEENLRAIDTKVHGDVVSLEDRRHRLSQAEREEAEKLRRAS